MNLIEDNIACCTECGSTDIIHTHNEYYCHNCGLVLCDQPLTAPRVCSKPLHTVHDYYNWNDNQFLHYNSCKSYLSKKEWRNQRKSLALRYIMVKLEMNNDERRSVYHILDHLSVKDIHSKACVDTVYAGVCRYVIGCLNPLRLRNIWYNKGILQECGLTRPCFNLIKNNIENKL